MHIYKSADDANRGRKLELLRRVAPLVMLAGMAATCLALPVSQATADSREAAAPSERLEWMLTTHDVRTAIHAPAAKGKRASDCQRNAAEPAR